MGLWYEERFGDRVGFSLRVERTLYAGKSEFQKIEIFDTAEFGRALAIDGIYMTSERDQHFYHEMLVHPALLTATAPKRVLIIGGGDGGTARHVLQHPEVEEVLMVEIDGEVVAACKEHMPGIGAWDDPRLELQIGDGIELVHSSDRAPFDIVLLDGSDPVGPAKGLFDRSFYLGVKRMLAPHGIFALQSESPILMRSLFLEIVTTLRGIFASASPYFGPVPLYAAGIWSWTYATDSADPLAIDDARARAIEPKCSYYNRDIHRAAFALPSDLRRELT